MQAGLCDSRYKHVATCAVPAAQRVKGASLLQVSATEQRFLAALRGPWHLEHALRCVTPLLRCDAGSMCQHIHLIFRSSMRPEMHHQFMP